MRFATRDEHPGRVTRRAGGGIDQIAEAITRPQSIAPYGGTMTIDSTSHKVWAQYS